MKYLFINKDSIKRALNSTWYAPNWEDDGKEEGGNNKSRSKSDEDIPNQTKPTKPTYQTKPTKPNLPNQTYQTKPTKLNLLVKAVNAWVRSAFGNIYSFNQDDVFDVLQMLYRYVSMIWCLNTN